jgi:adenine phosphoribosyltransferase
LIATGGSAAAAGQLIEKAGGKTLEYLFIISLPFLKGEEKLNAPSYSLIQAED